MNNCKYGVKTIVLLSLDPFLTSMFEKSKEKGSVWVTLKRSTLKRKLSSAGENMEYRCLLRATDAKKTISTSDKTQPISYGVDIASNMQLDHHWLRDLVQLLCKRFIDELCPTNVGKLWDQVNLKG